MFRRERVPVTPDGEVTDDFFLAPDIAIEVLSPRQSATRLLRRCLWYVQHGAGASLFVDPDDRSVLCFQADASSASYVPGDVIDLSSVFPGLTLDVTALFASLRVR